MKKLFYSSAIQARLIYTLLSMIFFNLGYSQIKGTIMDRNLDEGLIGVNVSMKNNSAVGTITDIDGSFELGANVGDTLTVSYVGYRTTDFAILGSDMGVLYLDEASELLDEVVVIGYGAVDKKDLTGVVTKVTEDDFVQGAISSPERLLNGKVAGLQISGNGEPGGGSRIRLRGGTSLDASSDPLIVIDGVPMDNRGLASSRNPLNFVNANDVASMTVLKDASASAIYGSRGANGVIIITTKSGKTGKPKLSYTGNANFSVFNGSPNHLSPENFRNAISNKAPQEIEFLGEVNTDWVSEVTQLATSTEHNLSMSGGSKKTKYFLSAGYLKSNGVLKNSAHEKKTFSGNISTKLFNDALSVSIKSRTGLTDDVFAPNVIGAAMAFDPTRPVLDPDSEFGGYYQWQDPLATGNPVSILDLNNNTGQQIRTLNNLTLTYDLPFIEGLSITSNTSYDYITGDKREFTSPLEKSNFDRGGRLFNEDLRNYTALIET